MADWGRRVDVVTWGFIGLNTCAWALSLGGVAALSRVYNGPSNNDQLAWWTIWFQAAAILVAAVVQHQKWYSSRTMVMGLFCALTALMMVQTHFANNQRQTAATNVAYSDLMLHQSQTLQNAQSSLPALPPQLAGTLSGIISGLNSGVSQAEAAVAAGGAGRKLLAGGRRLLATAAEIHQRADVVFVGFVFMTLLDLGLLVLFGIQHPHCKQRSPRVYISGGSVDQGCVQQGGGKEGGSGQISLQVMAVPMSRQSSAVSMHELRLPSSSSVTAYRLGSGGSPPKRPYGDRGPPSRQMSLVPLQNSMDRYPSRQLSIPPASLERCDPCPAPTIPTYPYPLK